MKCRQPTNQLAFINRIQVTIVIPISYNSNYFSNNKIANWEDVCANLIFYNFVTDSSKRLFEHNTYILNIYNRYENFYNKKPNKNYTKQHFFCRVKNVDYNDNGKIDEYDPAVLYVCDIYGNNLWALTSTRENVESFEIFEKLNFAMIKIQRDANEDHNFKNSENDYYYVKLDLKTLTFGKKIEIKQLLTIFKVSIVNSPHQLFTKGFQVVFVI